MALHPVRALAAALALPTAAFALAAAAAPAPAAVSYTTCTLSAHDSEHLGPTYVTSLKVHNRSCSFGKKLVKAYYACRTAHGSVAGRCHAKVLGFRCTETRQGISIQFNGKVTCTRGTSRVFHTYTQNT